MRWSGSSIVELLAHDDIEITAVGKGADALQALMDHSFDCCVLDLRLPDMSGFELLDRMQMQARLAQLPIVVFTGKELTADEEKQLKTVAKSIVLKDVQSPERLLDETALFLHRVVTDLPEGKQRMLERLHSSNEALRDRRVLMVDDDVAQHFCPHYLAGESRDGSGHAPRMGGRRSNSSSRPKILASC